jgi:hypothetical protein
MNYGEYMAGNWAQSRPYRWKSEREVFRNEIGKKIENNMNCRF